MALVLCAKRWTQWRGGHVTALIVDHGLRAASGSEAMQVQQWLHAMQVECVLLTLSMETQTTRIQERAREARYAALMQWCKAHQVLHLLVGHHADDQAETVLFRWLRHSGFAGLAGMSAVKEWRDLRVLRPLLQCSKQDCYDYLQASGQPWIDDPSNDNPDFTRVGLRSFLRTHAVNQRLSHVADKLATIRMKEEQQIAQLLTRHAVLYPYGVVQLERWQDVAEDALQVMVARALVTVNGGVEPLRESDVVRLVQWVRSAKASRRTLHGCVVELVDPGNLLIYQEHPSSVSVSLTTARLNWDRFTIICEEAHPDYHGCALGETGWRELRQRMDFPAAINRAIATTLPAIRHLDEWLCVPHIHYYSDRWVWPKPKMVFNPAKPLAGAPFYAMNEGQ